jgi:PEGA domain
MKPSTSHTTRINCRRGLWVLVALVLALSLGTGRVARSAPGVKKVSAPEKLRARKLFIKGVRSFARHQYPDALALFLASWKIKPKSIVLYNIAMCYKALFQYRRAITAFRQYIARRGKKLQIWKRRQITRSISRMTKKLGRLKLGVFPAGATVRVDGRKVGRAPLATVVLVDPGRRTVEVAARGYQTIRTEITVTAGQMVSMGIRLQPAVRVGKVVISSRAEGARASVDGGKLKALPLTLELKVGHYKVRVAAPGHSAQLLTVVVRPGEIARHNVGLIPLGMRRTGSRSVVKKWWFWTLVSVAVVAAGVSTGMLVWDRTRGGDPIDATWQLP